jgi:RHS repeat-associated protein
MAGNYHPAWMDSGKFYRALGLKNYELSNHLGNVLVTVSDKPIHKEISGNIYFEAEITTINDYYPFGSSLNTRGFSAGSGFRFGFNGKENFDKYQDYGFRIYYPELGKFLSVDPLTNNFAWNSVFSFSENCPIWGIDLDGGEFQVYLNIILNRSSKCLSNFCTSIYIYFLFNIRFMYSRNYPYWSCFQIWRIKFINLIIHFF